MAMDGMNDQAGSPDAQDQSLMESILGPSGDSSSETTSASGAASLSQGDGQAFKFAGRDWKGGQAEADKWARDLYGKFSTTQGDMKQIKSLLQNNPEAAQALAESDPQWAALLGKMGLQIAREEAQEAEAASERGQNEPQALYEQTQVALARLDIEREFRQLERRLGRDLTPEENNAVCDVIKRLNDVTAEEAYKLAFHDKILAEQAKKIGQQTKPAANGRPRPLPTGVQGTKVDTKKSIRDMNDAEYREHLKNSEEYQRLISREG